jgi:hypothetical protein
MEFIYQQPNLGKSWRDQKLVANQDNKKYIAATAGAAWHLLGEAA